MNTPYVLVAGDLVLDCHLYGGVKTDPSSFQEPGTTYHDRLGGAALCRKLLESTADVAGRKWDDRQRKWKEEHKRRVEQARRRDDENAQARAEGRPEEPAIPQLPWPDDLPADRPAPIFMTHQGVALDKPYALLPGHLRSYGVWTPHAPRKGAKDDAPRVWRVQKHFGYGPTDHSAGTASLSTVSPPSPAPPAVVLLDDGGIRFRHADCKSAWPKLRYAPADGPPPRIVYKMSGPLCRGELWAEVTNDAELCSRLTVLVSAADLRIEDFLIRQHLSWEQAALDVLNAFHTVPLAKQLLQAADVVVVFGSEGALWLHQPAPGKPHEGRLLFDPANLEGDFERDFDGTVYGFHTCLAVAVVHHLAIAAKGSASAGAPDAAAQAERFERALARGVTAGLAGRRKLLEAGHGLVGDDEPGFPLGAVAAVVSSDQGGFVEVRTPAIDKAHERPDWNILADSEAPDGVLAPHVGLAQLVAIFGRSALSQAPCLSKGELFAVDRSEIESLRTLERLIREYERTPAPKRPLSIGVFGPPGAGKSFGVKALSKAVLGAKVPLLEFNLSQFKTPDELLGAFHRVRDEVLKGATPVAFWDEFDSQHYKWLQYLLAPMQDGSFQQGEITHPIGKCIFIFAGGTADCLATFGVAEPKLLEADERKQLVGVAREDRLAEEQAWREFKLLKGPDFISRLHGHLDVLGPNQRRTCPDDETDLTWPIRRALMLRGTLRLDPSPKQADRLEIDRGLLFALLKAPRYNHGSRSFEKILLTLQQSRPKGRYHRSALPPDPLLHRETDAEEFHRLMNLHSEFQTHPDLEKIAEQIHENYLRNAKKMGWPVAPRMNRSYAELDHDAKESNRGAARRIPELLALISFKILPNPSGGTDWIEPLEQQIRRHRERLAQAEHLGWNAERLASGWTYAPKRDDAKKQHDLIVDWSQLSETQKNKDRENMDKIPTWLKLAGYQAVPAGEKA